jgi:signal transduction histidine kinase
MSFLVGLASVWLIGSYHMSEQSVRRQADFLFTNSIRSVEDSLIESNFGNENLRPSDTTNIRSRFVLNFDTTIRQPGAPRDTIAGGRIFRRQWRQKRKERSKDGIFGSIGWQLAFARNQKLDDELERDSLASEDLLASVIYSLIEKQLTTQFAENDFPGTYRFEPGQVDDKDPRRTKIYTDLYTGKEFQLTILPKRWEIMKMMSWQFFFVFLTLLLTMLSFILTYRSLINQHRLTLMKNDLISNISHELKTPISTVKVALEALEDFKAGEDATKRNEYLQISKSELDRLALLVDNVLKTSLAENGLNLELERLNITSLVSDILETMKLQFEKANALVEFERGGDLYVNADRLHLTSVLYNLIDNALKYSEGNPDIKIALAQKERKVLLTVSDHGKGIPKMYISKIFDKFFRVPAGNTHDIKGYGMGLSYVAKVVEQHHGSIAVESSAGVGTQFVISFPENHVEN